MEYHAQRRTVADNAGRPLLAVGPDQVGQECPTYDPLGSRKLLLQFFGDMRQHGSQAGSLLQINRLNQP